jgi:hypothetical protein
MWPPAWIEENLLVLGLASVFAGVMLGLLCSAFQARRTRAALRENLASRTSPPSAAKARPAPDLGRAGAPRGNPAPVTVPRMRPGGEPIARTGAPRRARTPGRRG